MDKCLLDTDIFSEILRARDKRLSFREREYRMEWGILTISAVTVMEVFCGLLLKPNASRLARFEGVVHGQEVVPFGAQTADLAGKISARLQLVGQPIGFPDAMIAATAIEHGLILVTGNTAHFERIRQLGFPLLLANWRDADR